MGIRSTVVGAAIAAAMIVTPALAGAASSDFGRDRPAAVGLTDGGTSLVTFRTDQPFRVKKVGSVSGLDGDAKLVGIDYRVQNGKLYGVGNAGGIYLLSTSDAKAGKVGQLSVALSGSTFGVDFNPAANALRVVSDNGQNLRQPFPATGDSPTAPTVADTGLTLPPVPPNPAVTATGVSAAAYTNNDLDATTGTTLFDINTALDQVAIQSPANNGTLAPTGGLRIDADLDAGFDIYAKLRGGRTVEVTGFATLTSGGTSALYSVDLLGGAVDRVGKFPVPVTDLAVALDRR